MSLLTQLSAPEGFGRRSARNPGRECGLFAANEKDSVPMRPVLATWLAGLLAAMALGVPARADDDPYYMGEMTYRRLAPWTMKSVDPQQQVNETFTWEDMTEIVGTDEDLEWARDVDFRRTVWALDFQFKPLRTIHVDIPQPTGRMQRKLIWYMVYSVTNRGRAWQPELQADGTHEIAEVDQPIRFAPSFLLHSPEYNKAYPDRVIPLAISAIRAVEDPARPFLSSAEISRELEVGETLWGIATWEDVDPRIKQIALCVYGLTNAYRWRDDVAAFDEQAAVEDYRRFFEKVLKLNFWRPGDGERDPERRIRYGIPGEVDYEWVYR